MRSTTEQRAPASTADHEVTVRVVAESPSPTRRRTFLTAVTALVLGAVALGVVLAAGVVTGLLDIGNPFATTTVDRTPPAVLRELDDMSRYTAARGNFQSTVDIEDDVGLLPAFVAGEHTVYLAQGNVDAVVDFSALPSDAVQKSADGAITVTLPKPRLARAVVDAHASHVVSRNRGIVNRIADAFSENPHTERRYVLVAQDKLARAARHSGLVHRAERNTTRMLQGFLGKLGYDRVQVEYADPAAAA
jgi:hypothetical protein